jgi:hypothetical protein
LCHGVLGAISLCVIHENATGGKPKYHGWPEGARAEGRAGWILFNDQMLAVTGMRFGFQKLKKGVAN